MNPKAKKVSTGVLALTAVSIWIPQLLMGVVQTQPTPRPEVDNSGGPEGAFEESALGDAVPDDVGADATPMDAAELEPEFSDPMATDTGDPQGAPSPAISGSLSKQLEVTSEQLRNFGAGRQRVDLDALLQSFQDLSTDRQSQSTQTAQPVLIVQEGGGSPHVSIATSGLSIVASDPLQEFATQNVMSAIIHGKSDSLAILGNRIVRVGDEIDGIRVAEIDSRRIRMESEKSTRWLTLPPFQTRRATDSDEGADEDSTSEGEQATEESSSTNTTGGTNATNQAADSTPTETLSAPNGNTQQLPELPNTSQPGGEKN